MRTYYEAPMKCDICDAFVKKEELGVVLQGEDYNFSVCGKCLMEMGAGQHLEGMETDDEAV